MSELKRVMEEHKKCPCCDSDDISVGSKCVSIGEDIYIRCNSCGLKMQLCKEYGWKELLKRWNTRKPMQNIVERLREKAKEPMYQHHGDNYYVGIYFFISTYYSIEKAIKLLTKEYERAKRLSFVRNPVAYALYQVWKMSDEKGGAE